MSAAERQQVAADEMAKLRAQIPVDTPGAQEVNNVTADDGEPANTQSLSDDAGDHGELKQSINAAEPTAPPKSSLFKSRRSIVSE